MADTLTEWAKLEKDLVVKGVFEEILTADFLMTLLKFKSFEGNSLVYNRELTLPSSVTHAVGDTWETTKPTFTKKTASLATVGNQSGVDLYIRETRGSVQDPNAVNISLMTKSLTRELGRLIIKGEPESTTTHFEGLDSLCRAETRMMAMDDGNVDGPGAAETELTLDRLDAMIDQIHDGQTKPDALIMNNTMRRKLTSLARSSSVSGIYESNVEMFGHKVSTYDGIPIVRTNHITDSEQYNDTGTWSSSTATTIFGVQFGEDKQGYTIMHNGPVMQPRMRRLGVKRDEEIEEFRLVVYIQALTFSTKRIIALGGIDSAS
jgi:hypothetical protein